MKNVASNIIEAKVDKYKIKWYKGVKELSFLLASSPVKSKADSQTSGKSRTG